MTWLVTARSMLYFLLIACTYLFFMLWLIQDDVDSRVAYVITRMKQPVDRLFLDVFNENQIYNAMWATSTSQTSDSSHPPRSPTQYENNFTEELQDGKHVQREDTVDDNFLRAREEVYRLRRGRVEGVCNKLGTTVTFGSVKKAPLGRLRWLNSRRLIMCYNAKVGTSSWSYYLLRLSKRGLSHIHDLHNTAKAHLVPPQDRYSPKTLALMKKFAKIMNVRHPFARIVSAYLDKIKQRLFKKLADHIVKVHRSPTSSSKSKIPTFEEFVKHLVNATPAVDDISRRTRSGEDIHWKPFYVNCAPCDIHYDIILNMETIDEDTRYVSHRFDLGVTEHFRNNSASMASEITALNFFKKLPRDLILALYERYRIDFDMFGYSITPFLEET